MEERLSACCLERGCREQRVDGRAILEDPLRAIKQQQDALKREILRADAKSDEKASKLRA